MMINTKEFINKIEYDKISDRYILHMGNGNIEKLNRKSTLNEDAIYITKYLKNYNHILRKRKIQEIKKATNI